MPALSTTEFILIAAGAVMMIYVLLQAIGQSAMILVTEETATRRALEARRHAEDAAAEAAGRAAALEPLDVNPDGSIVEPILAMVEQRDE